MNLLDSRPKRRAYCALNSRRWRERQLFVDLTQANVDEAQLKLSNTNWLLFDTVAVSGHRMEFIWI